LSMKFSIVDSGSYYLYAIVSVILHTDMSPA